MVIAFGKIVVPWACVIGLAVLIGCRDVTRAVVRKMHTLTKPAFRDGCICRGAWGVWSYILRRVGRPTPETAWGPCVRAEDGERLDTARPTTNGDPGRDVCGMPVVTRGPLYGQNEPCARQQLYPGGAETTGGDGLR